MSGDPIMPKDNVEITSDIISRIGQLTRMLRDSLRELGLDKAIAEAATNTPDTKFSLP